MILNSIRKYINVAQLKRRFEADVASLIDILSHQRPYNTPGEEAFIEKYLDVIPGMQKDEVGNRFITVGAAPRVMWSCHTDTVASKDGRQNVKWDGTVLGLNKGKPGQCLGADDGAGMWLMLEMLKANKPGLYIFHRGEERGGIGSDHIATKTPELVEGIQIAIAFDRKALHSIITEQSGGMCASDEFAASLALQLNQTPGFNYEADDTGVFTDTANYTDLIPECTNLSVGYYREHGPMETLDVAHLIKLRSAILELDVDQLVVKREPGEGKWQSRYRGYFGYGNMDDDDWYENFRKRFDASMKGAWGEKEEKPDYSPDRGGRTYSHMYDLVSDYPYVAALILEELGVTLNEVADYVYEEYQEVVFVEGERERMAS